MTKQEIEKTIRNFTQMMLDKQPDVQSVKIIIGMKDKTNIKFKQFRSNIIPTD